MRGILKLKKTNWLFLAYLLVVGFLLVNNFAAKLELTKRKNNITTLEGTIEKLSIALAEENLISTIEGKTISLNNLEESGTPVTQKEKSDYLVAILFTHLDCGSCVSRELRLWQEFYYDAKAIYKTDVVAIAKIPNPQLIQTQLRGVIRYPLFFDVVDDSTSIFAKLNVQIGRPMVVLYNRRYKKIIYAHIADVEVKEKSIKFQNKVIRYLIGHTDI